LNADDPTRDRTETVGVTVQWAVRGKKPDETDYRVLDCADGHLSRANFDTILERYESGVVDDLPQVTVLWHDELVGLGIHDWPLRAAVDAAGREFMQTSYYCVPFEDLAEHRITYSAMYREFLRHPLPVPNHAIIKASLDAAGPSVPALPLASRAAALLLGGAPVCVLGGEQLKVEERLSFIDDVAALLPYGMRSHMSATTWAKSTLTQHKIRLFFADAEREAADSQLTWGTDRLRSSATRHFQAYLRWLQADLPGRVAQLAAATQPTGFQPQDVDDVLRELGVLSRPPSAVIRRRQRAVPTAGTLLGELARNLNAGHHEAVGRKVKELWNYAARADPATASSRKLISQLKLLRSNVQLAEPDQQEYYSVLIRLAFPEPIDYQSFCEIENLVLEASGGNTLRELPKALARAINTMTRLDLIVVLLSFRAIGPVTLYRKLNECDLTDLFDIVHDGRWHAQHRRWIIDSLVPYITSESIGREPEQIRDALLERGFLAGDLNHLYSQSEEKQREKLSALLTAVYGSPLDRIGAGRARACDWLCEGARAIRPPDCRFPGDSFQDRNHGDGDRGGAPAHVSHLRPNRCRSAGHGGDLDGEVFRLRDVGTRHERGDADPGRRRLHDAASR